MHASDHAATHAGGLSAAGGASPAHTAAVASATVGPRADTPRTQRALRYLRLALHVVHGVLTIALIHPFTRHSTHLTLRRRWSQGLLRFVATNSLRPFIWYRVPAGLLLALAVGVGWLAPV